MSIFPWLSMAVSANFGGWIADSLVSKGASATMVRKIMQTIGFLGPAFFLTQLSHVDSPAMAIVCMACSQRVDAFSQSGLYSNHQDIAPRYSGVVGEFRIPKGQNGTVRRVIMPSISNTLSFKHELSLWCPQSTSVNQISQPCSVSSDILRRKFSVLASSFTNENREFEIVGGGNASGYAARTFVEHGMADGKLCIESKESATPIKVTGPSPHEQSLQHTAGLNTTILSGTGITIGGKSFVQVSQLAQSMQKKRRI